MTTNVIDMKHFTAACDSRWTIHSSQLPVPYTTNGFRLWVDNTGFEKIIVYQKLCYIFAGPADLISEWKQWVWTMGPVKNPDILPDVKSKTGTLHLHIVSVGQNPSLARRIGGRPDLELEPDKGGIFFAGTGSVPAYEGWQRTLCARLAVQAAIEADVASGGRVIYRNLKDDSDMKPEDITMGNIPESLRRKVMVKHYSDNEGTGIPAYQSSDQRVLEALSQVVSGSATLVAPCGTEKEDWTQEEKNSLSSFFKDFYGTK